MTAIAVLGAGAWGTALATVAARAGHPVILWGRDQDVMAAMAKTRENARHLPGVPLAAAVRPTAELGASSDADLILAAVPSQALRPTLLAVAPMLRRGAPVVVCAKGLERGSGLLLSHVVRSVLTESPPAVLSGPSFAADVGRGLPTAVTLAAETLSQAAAIASVLATPEFRLYQSDDLVGVEIGGAVKNVLAIACGIAQGRGLGASAVAALTARAFAELSRYGRACGARPDTLGGLSGLGDLVLTCCSTQSRNFSVGRALGQGADLAAACAGRLAEGVHTAPVLLAEARERGVRMPIVESVDAILGGRVTVDGAIEALLARPAGAEAM